LSGTIWLKKNFTQLRFSFYKNVGMKLVTHTKHDLSGKKIFTRKRIFCLKNVGMTLIINIKHDIIQKKNFPHNKDFYSLKMLEWDSISHKAWFHSKKISTKNIYSFLKNVRMRPKVDQNTNCLKQNFPFNKNFLSSKMLEWTHNSNKTWFDSIKKFSLEKEFFLKNVRIRLRSDPKH